MITIALDAHGGDLQPLCNIEGAVLALQEEPDLTVVLVGDEAVIKESLKSFSYDRNRMRLVHAPEIIDPNESPVLSFQRKKNSSLVQGFQLLKQGAVNGFVSAGSTGAVLVGAQVLGGKLKGVKRAPLCVELPTVKGTSVLIDAGANVDIKPEVLRQFALMGNVYAEEILKKKNPTVGLVNIGTEEEKGNDLTKAAYTLLKETESLHFIGNAEARDIPYGIADVYVCEGFTGNIVLKMYEGVSKALIQQIKEALYTSLRAKIGGLLIKPALKSLLKKFDSSKDGGAPMLGLNGLVMKAHGNSTSLQIKNAILQSVRFNRTNLNGRIKEIFEHE